MLGIIIDECMKMLILDWEMRWRDDVFELVLEMNWGNDDDWIYYRMFER